MRDWRRSTDLSTFAASTLDIVFRRSILDSDPVRSDKYSYSTNCHNNGRPHCRGPVGHGCGYPIYIVGIVNILSLPDRKSQSDKGCFCFLFAIVLSLGIKQHRGLAQLVARVHGAHRSRGFESRISDQPEHSIFQRRNRSNLIARLNRGLQICLDSATNSNGLSQLNCTVCSWRRGFVPIFTASVLIS